MDMTNTSLTLVADIFKQILTIISLNLGDCDINHAVGCDAAGVAIVLYHLLQMCYNCSISFTEDLVS